MDVGKFGCLRHSRVDDSHQKTRLLFLVAKHCRRIGYIVAYHGIGSPEDKEVRTVDVREGMHILAAKCFATHPEKTGELLGQGAIMILRTQPIQKANT